MTENKTFTAEEFVEKSLNQFMRNVTDKVFLMIQNDHGLMQKYLDLVRVQDGGRLNAFIGKLIIEKFRLDDDMASGQLVNGIPQRTVIKTRNTKHCLDRGMTATPQKT